MACTVRPNQLERSTRSRGGYDFSHFGCATIDAGDLESRVEYRMKPDELRSIRLSLALTQEELASEFGVHRVSVSRWEAGTHRIPPMVELAIETLNQRRSTKQGENGLDKATTPQP